MIKICSQGMFFYFITVMILSYGVIVHNIYLVILGGCGAIIMITVELIKELNNRRKGK